MNNPDQNNSNNKQTNQKKGKGRKKIKIAKIANIKNLQVTYSKRRVSIIKKASELSTFTGAETAIVLFSSKGKAHSFGSPNLEMVANRFLNNDVPVDVDPYIEAGRHTMMQKNIEEQVKLKGQVEYEKKLSIELNKMMNQIQGPADFDRLNLLQLLQVDRTVKHFNNMLHAAAENVQGTTTIVPSRPLQTDLPLNFVHSHAPAASASPQACPSSTTPVYNPSITYGDQLAIGWPSGMNISDSSGMDIGGPMFSNYLSTPFPAGGSYGTDVGGPSHIPMHSESWYPSGVDGNIFPSSDGTFGEYDGQSSYPDGNPGNVIQFNDGMNFGYPGDFGVGPTND